MMEQIFRHQPFQDLFNRYGFVKIPWYEEHALNEVLQMINYLNPDDSFKGLQKSLPNPQSFHSTFLDTNLAYKLSVWQILSDLFNDFVRDIFYEYEMIQANVFIKPPHTGYVHAHQNLTMVDEKKYTTISLWCPYESTNEFNGTMRLVPGSQKRFARYRSTDITWPYFESLGSYSLPLYKSLNVNKGEVLVFDDSIIHGTDINHSNHPRIVFHAIIKPSKAPMFYYEVNEKNNQVLQRKVVDPLFWQKFVPGVSKLPEEVTAIFANQSVQIGEQAVLEELAALPFDKR